MSSYTRSDLIRDSLVFQGKLIIDGFRDLLLVPVALAATILDLIAGEDTPPRNFQGVLNFGRRTERWIGLFSASGRIDSSYEPPVEDELDAMLNVDGLVDQVERLIVREYEREGSKGSPRDVIDRTWKRIDRRRRALKRVQQRDQGEE